MPVSPSPRQRRPLAAVLAIAIATAPLASALAGPAEDKATARELAKEGIAAQHKGDCNVAIERLERAESLFHAPPHLQFLARCYTKVGRLVDATETWRRLTLESLPATSPQAFKDAVAEANAELPKLEPRLAHLTLRAAVKYDGLSVEVDGKTWPTAALDVARVIDPGTHALRAKATGFKTHEQSITVTEGASDTVVITLDAGADPLPAASASASSSASAAPRPTASTVPTSPPTPPLRYVGVVTAGVGVLALAGGAITGLSASAKFTKLESDCPVRSSCTVADLEQRKSSIQRLDTATNILLIGGGILVAAGVGLTILAPSPKGNGRTVALSVLPFSSGGHVSLSGSF